MKKVLVRGSLSKGYVGGYVVKMKLGVGRGSFGDSTPGPMSLLRVAGGRRRAIFVLTSVIQQFGNCLRTVLTSGARPIVRGCLRGLCQGSNFRPCASGSKDFRTRVRSVRPDKRLGLVAPRKIVGHCTFGRIERLVLDPRGSALTLWPVVGRGGVTGFGEVLLGLDNRDVVKRRHCNVSRGHLTRCTRRVGRVRSVKMRVKVIVKNNGVFHNLDNTNGKFSLIGNSRVNVYTAIVGSLKLDDTLKNVNMGDHMLATVHVRPVKRFCAG